MAPARGLEQQKQKDFAAGAIRSAARHLISSRGTYDVLNGFHTDDGSIYRRGGVALHSAVSGAPKWIWDGVVGPALERTVLAVAAAFHVLDVDDEARVDLGGAGLSAPVKPAVLDGILFIPGGTLYGGSRETADYSTGTVSGAAGLKVLTGVGTSWLTNVDPGMLIRLAGAGRYYVVASVASDTSLTLMQPLLTSPAGAAYAATRLGTAALHGVRAEAAALPIVAAHENRLVVGVDDAVYFSNGVDPTTGGLRTETFDETDFHKVPSGVDLIALESLRDRLLAFTSGGIYAVTNMAYNLVDPRGNAQQRLERITEDVVAWSAPAICSYAGALVVPALDDVYVLDGISQIAVGAAFLPLLRAAVKSGTARPGGAVVFNGHLLLPITDSSANPDETWAVRLDRPVLTSRGEVFAFSRLDGGAAVSCFAKRTRVGAAPMLLAADPGEGASVDCSAFFAPDSSARGDVANAAFRWMVETRDFETGSGQENQVRRFRARYELVSASSVARLSAFVSTGAPVNDSSPLWGEEDWGDFEWGSSVSDDFVQMTGQAPEDDGRTPFTWAPERRCRFIRFRVESSDLCDSLVLRAIDLWTRRSGKI